MNYHFIAADSLQKVVMLTALFLWQALAKHGNLEWMITLFSLSTLPNTLVMGIPLLSAMYGEFSGGLMVQIVVLQSVIWYTLMLFMFEYRGAKLLISDQFPETGGSITSFKVDSDVISLNGRELLQADAEIGDDGKLHVVVRRSNTPSLVSSFKSNGLNSITNSAMTPRASNLTGVEIYSVQSSREPTPRASSFNQTDFYAMFGSKAASPKHGYSNSQQGGFPDIYSSLQSSKVATPRTSNFDEDAMRMNNSMTSSTNPKRIRSGGQTLSGELYNNGGSHPSSYPPPNPMFSASTSGNPRRKVESGGGAGRGGQNINNKDLHMFVWSSSVSPASEANTRNASTSNIAADPSGKAASLPQENTASKAMQELIDSMTPLGKKPKSGNHNPNKEVHQEVQVEEGNKQVPAVNGAPYSNCQKKKVVDMDEEGGGEAFGRKHRMPPASVMTRLILIMVWRKLIRNPNTYSSLLGLTWSLVSFRWNIEMPSIVKGSISILSDAGLGMAMFSLGLFMALQPRIIACGKSVATFSMAVRFLTGPAVIAATSIAIGLRGVLLHVAIVQGYLWDAHRPAHHNPLLHPSWGLITVQLLPC
ncbi:hypothetical protein SAY87_007410 [Trapa incisa]|uniref:Auxin efflux carrier component n=1 Tax=Trapa incisa TaxID=236973 RepID=A0AAN7K4B4_9MYRT|nr:hypothetical protein SAY87_007410 [Trapa incisa]